MIVQDSSGPPVADAEADYYEGAQEIITYRTEAGRNEGFGACVHPVYAVKGSPLFGQP